MAIRQKVTAGMFAPKTRMVELKHDEMTMKISDVQLLLERVLRVSKSDKGVNPNLVYAKKLNQISQFDPFDKNLSASEMMDKIQKMRDDIKLLDMYFDLFVVPIIQEEIEFAKAAAVEAAMNVEQKEEDKEVPFREINGIKVINPVEL